MGEIQKHYPVLLIAAVVSRYDDAFDAAREMTSQHWGEIVMESPRWEFTETKFYHATMGLDLKKQFFVYRPLIAPNEIAEAKIASNQMEADYAARAGHPESRPLNIDPGYISQAKLVLATTKDRDHRIYLQQGIFAEVTLYFRSGEWTKSRWTYPDYQRSDFQDFFSECRKHLRETLRNSQ